jgi:hypothetical protein
METNKYYVYAILDPRKPGKYYYADIDVSFLYEPFYIGKGCIMANGKERFYYHLKEAILFKDLKNPKYNPFKCNKIRKILKENKNPIFIKMKEQMYSKDALLLESHFISKIGRFNLNKGPLTNLTDGGEGSAGIKKTVSEKTKQLLREYKGEKHHGFKKPLSEEHKKKISKSNTGKVCSEEAKQKLSISSSRFKNIKNPWAKCLKITSPDNKIYYIKGFYRIFCEKYNISHSTLEYSRKYNRPIKWGKTKNWKLEYVDENTINNILINNF